MPPPATTPADLADAMARGRERPTTTGSEPHPLFSDFFLFVGFGLIYWGDTSAKNRGCYWGLVQGQGGSGLGREKRGRRYTRYIGC